MLCDYCSQFGKSYEKFIPELIMNAPPRQLRIFWDFYMLGDGTYAPRKSKSGRGKHERYAQLITTSSKKMADQLMEVAQKIGFSASMRTRPAMKDVPLFEAGRICQVRESYVIALRGSMAMAAKAKKVNYQGSIHCVTVPNSFLYVRRNGRPSWCGNSSLEPIAAMQAILNRINGGVLDTVYGAIERPLMGPKAAFSQQDWDTIDPNNPGVKVPYNNNSPREPRYLEAPQLPQYVAATQDRIEREMDQTSGASAISQAIAKKQVPGGDALDMIFNSRSTNIRLMGRGLKSFLVETGGLVVADMMQFYSARHRLLKYGAKGIVANDLIPWYGQLLPAGMEPEQFVKSVNFTIRRGSVLAIEKAEKIPVAFALRKGKDLSRRKLFAFLDTNINLDENEAELKAEMAEKAAIGAAAGALSGKGHKK